jgi:hypothetical protein
MNGSFTLSDVDEIKAYSAPVVYKSTYDFVRFFADWVDQLTSNLFI